MLELQRMEKEQLNFKRMREDAERAEEDEFKKQVGVVPRIARQQSLLSSFPPIRFRTLLCQIFIEI